MKMSVRHPDHVYFKVIDLETGEEIQQCIVADDDTGEYILRIMPGESGNEGQAPIMKHRKGKIKLIDVRSVPAST